MSWQTCLVCEGAKVVSKPEETEQKVTNYHEPSSSREFRISIVTHCFEKEAEADENDEPQPKMINFYVDLAELCIVCPYFQKFSELSHLEISKNCTDAWVSAPGEVASSRENTCCHNYKSTINAKHFHAFLESLCPSLYGIRPAPITMESIIPLLDMLSHFHSEPLLTNCERFLMTKDISQLEGSQLIRVLDRGLCVSLDHRILGRILCICLMNTASKMSDVSQELTGPVGSVFAQAFIANTTKSFRHVKPLEQENDLWPVALRHLMIPTAPAPSISEANDEAKKKKNRGHKRNGECDHTEDSFECILCFDQRCGKCKGENAYCYKALDNFLYEVRLQLYPHTYRAHLDRDMLREDRLSDYILRHQLQPRPEE
ncbi:hypothetical protein L3Y34_018957 [Caenorhabditis briggsae]|uniref:Uncharacterized protein n=1 Tax=Caenorhabditis briggsae TaxID=6238 RepID=A0AAE9IVH6_CAEBR|nr:hypothetical protein L3Y34_018957 [Caenorhabditis briggsae]